MRRRGLARALALAGLGGALLGCGARTPLEGEAEGAGEGDTPGEDTWQPDPSCVAEPCAGACAGEVEERQRIPTGHAYQVALATMKDGDLVLGGGTNPGLTGVFDASPVFVSRISPGGAVRWVAGLPDALDWGPTMDSDVDAFDGVVAVYPSEIEGPALEPGPSLVVSRISPGGELVATRSISSALPDGVVARAGPDGTVFVAGGSWRPLDFGDGPTVPREDTAHGFLVKLGPASELLWSKVVDLPHGSDWTRLAVGPRGEVAVIFEADFENPTVHLYEADGGLRWSLDLVAYYNDAVGVAWTPDGDLLLAGSLNDNGGDGVADLGGGPFDFEGLGTWLGRYDAQGRPRWIRFMRSAASITSMAATDDGGIVLAGGTFDGLDLLGAPLLEGRGSGQLSVFVTKLDGCGEVSWTRPIPATPQHPRIAPLPGGRTAFVAWSAVDSGPDVGHALFARLGP